MLIVTSSGEKRWEGAQEVSFGQALELVEPSQNVDQLVKFQAVMARASILFKKLSPDEKKQGREMVECLFFGQEQHPKLMLESLVGNNNQDQEDRKVGNLNIKNIVIVEEHIEDDEEMKHFGTEMKANSLDEKISLDDISLEEEVSCRKSKRKSEGRTREIKTLVVKGLDNSTTARDITAKFQQFGKVVNVYLKDGNLKGWAFVEFRDRKALLRALQKGRVKIGGKDVSVNMAHRSKGFTVNKLGKTTEGKVSMCCRYWNSSGGCHLPESECRYKHQCSVVLREGRVCWARKHYAANHE